MIWSPLGHNDPETEYLNWTIHWHVMIRFSRPEGGPLWTWPQQPQCETPFAFSPKCLSRRLAPFHLSVRARTLEGLSSIIIICKHRSLLNSLIPLSVNGVTVSLLYDDSHGVAGERYNRSPTAGIITLIELNMTLTHYRSPVWRLLT